jgi:hypothetical protein
MLIWFSLYYFTFEMKLIQIALTFNSPIDYTLKKRRYFLVKYATLGFLIIYGCFMSTIVGLQYSDLYAASDFTFIKLVLKSLKLVTDISIHILFI